MPSLRSAFETDEVAYVRDLVAVDSAVRVLVTASFAMLAFGLAGILFTGIKLSSDEAGAVAIVGYAVPTGLLAALTWGTLYGLSAVIRAVRVVADASRLERDESLED